MPTPAPKSPASAPSAAAGAPVDIDNDVLAIAAARMGLKLPPATAPAATPSAEKAEDANTEPPAREEGETDEAYAARLEDAGFDPAEVIKPADGAGADETEEERTARLQQQDGEEDEAYEARLAEENLTRDDVPAPAAEPTEEEKKAAAQKARDAADLKKLPEAVRKTAQDIIDKRIGRITAKAEAEKTELRNQVAKLEADLTEAKAAGEGKPSQVIAPEGMHPLLLDPSEDAIARYVKAVESFEDWAVLHEDGFEPSAEDAAKGVKAVSKQEIRSRLHGLQRERDKIVPQAREILTKRASADTEARKLLPAFFDATKPEYQAARTLLREQPELRRFPDYMLRAAEIVLGRKALADLRAAAGKPPKPKTPPPRAPRAPGGGGAPRGGPLERNRAADPASAVSTALKTGKREDKRAAALAVLM